MQLNQGGGSTVSEKSHDAQTEVDEERVRELERELEQRKGEGRSKNVTEEDVRRIEDELKR
jgi:hypothetical protein